MTLERVVVAVTLIALIAVLCVAVALDVIHIF